MDKLFMAQNERSLSPLSFLLPTPWYPSTSSHSLSVLLLSVLTTLEFQSPTTINTSSSETKSMVSCNVSNNLAFLIWCGSMCRCVHTDHSGINLGLMQVCSWWPIWWQFQACCDHAWAYCLPNFSCVSPSLCHDWVKYNTYSRSTPNKLPIPRCRSSRV